MNGYATPQPVCGACVNLMGSCPGNATSVQWSFISGPATPTLTSANSQYAQVCDLVPGDYVFRYTVTGGCGPGTKDVTVNVGGASAVTAAVAGPDQYYCEIPSSVSVTANAPAVGETGTWTQLMARPQV